MYIDTVHKQPECIAEKFVKHKSDDWK